MTSNKEIIASYKLLDTFTVKIINGELDTEGSKKTENTYFRGKTPAIIMNYAPEGMQFFQWEVVECDNSDYANNAVYQPFAEKTTLNAIRGNITIRATYYVPDPEVTYVLTVIGKNGETTTYNYPVGYQFELVADLPDDGYKFFKWTGDSQYLIDRYSERTILNMPAKNIELGMEYRREGSAVTYHVELANGELYLEDEGRWVSDGEFEERTELQIRATSILPGFKFNAWVDDDGVSVKTVNDPSSPTTTLTVGDFSIYLSAETIRYTDYKFTIANPIDPSKDAVTNTYYETAPVAVYFDLPTSDDDIHYNFVRWSGNDLAYLKLFDGGAFNVMKAGDADNPQVIKMPGRNISISGIYTTSYRVIVTNGTINGETEGYFVSDSKVKVKADNLGENLIFAYWEGDIGYLNSKYKAEAELTIPKEGVRLKAKYIDINNRNSIGIVNNNLYDDTKIDASMIELVSGKLEVGTILFDNIGHIYIVNHVDNEVSILRLTVKEDNDGE